MFFFSSSLTFRRAGTVAAQSLDARVELDLGSLDHFRFSRLKGEAILGLLRPLLVQQSLLGQK